MSNGRVRRGPDEWRTILERYNDSGLGRREFCRKEKLNLTSFQRWQKRLGEPKPQSQFVEVTPVQETSSWAVEIELATGTIVRLRG